MVSRKILVPDVHGRTFWKKVIKYAKDCQITFLGDYLDPYPQEGITKEDAIENFKEIIKFARENKNSVKLLLGNHDLTYFCDGRYNVNANRIDYTNYKQICSLFNSNKDLFQLTDFFICSGGSFNYLLSHAGVSSCWIQDCIKEGFLENLDCVKDGFLVSSEYIHADVIEMSETLNKLFNEGDPKFIKLLGNVGYERWGSSETGSIVWCDVREMDSFGYNGVGQIFGHTQQIKHPYFSKEEIICIDCREVFSIDEFGCFCDIDGYLYEER